MTDRYDIRLLNPDDVYFSRGEGGVFQRVVDGKPYDELIVHWTFPFRYPSAYISIRTTKDEELGIVRGIEELHLESAIELRKELLFRYFIPQVYASRASIESRFVAVEAADGSWTDPFGDAQSP
ncbi:hypothetical protein J2T17_006583 [Paenibacillus mucilaginosus]|uniref:DUF1854 domain-containing protein n=1 Tax=Paenibacillus mucilaginosus TaxID=61624 RepID=UPI003D1CCDDB